MPTSEATPLKLAEVDRLIQGHIRPVPLPFTYRAGLLGIAASLVLLQLIYVAMVLLAAAAALAYLVFIVPALLATMRVNILSILLIFGPPAALAIVAFFLLKPLLARPAKEPDPLELKREDAPVLFAWVERICSAIGSPPPRRILIDLDVNASASLTRGWRGFITNHLTLTIGLPLLRGLTLKQFSGVMAHEFGHFTQTIGMRLYFTIVMIRRWFLRVAYERDKWDEKLERMSQSGDWRVRAVMNLAKGAVSFSRWVLRGLQHVATWVSAWFSRQMEFDADRHEAALVGDLVSTETHFRLAMLSAASQAAWQDVNQLWTSKQRTADFTALLSYREHALSDDSRQEIKDGILAETTNRWATHPCVAERIRNVEGIQGLIAEPLDQPAHVLIQNCASICERATEHRYTLSVGDERLNATLLSAVDSIEKARASIQRANAFQIVFGIENRPWRWFRVPPEDEPLPEEITVKIRTEHDQEYWTWLETSLNRYAAMEYVRSGGKIQPSGFSLTHSDLTGIEPEVREARERLAQEATKLRDFYASNAHVLSRKEPELRNACVALSAAQEQLLELRHQWAACAILLENLERLPASTAATARESSLSRLRGAAIEIIQFLDREPSPLKPNTSLAGDLLQRPAAEAERMDPQELAIQVLNGSDQLAEEILSEWCVRSLAQSDSQGPQSHPDSNATAAANGPSH